VSDMEDRPDELSLISQAVLAISRQMPVREVLQVIVDSARTLVGARYAALGVPDESGSFGEFVVSGMSADLQGAIGDLPKQHGMLGALLRDAKAERLTDITADPRYEGWLPKAHPMMKAFLGVPVWGVPARGAACQVLGIIFAANKKDGFTERDTELLTLFAGHAAIALTNARLLEANRELSAVEERERLARELHDAVAQKLFSIRAHSRAAAVLVARDSLRAETAMNLVTELAGEAQDELRAVIEGLAPPSLAGLEASLCRYAALAGRAHGIGVTVTARGIPVLDQATEVTVYRVAQEALHNALRHSGGRHVAITLRGTSKRLVLEVTDDGGGFDAGAASGIGLVSMRERAAAAGGAVRVTSKPGEGTTVRLEVPV
jgi:signal transduction histidine kinase